MKIKILSWNVRGLNEADKRSTIKSMIYKWRADIVCLQETKIEDGSSQRIRQVWGNRWVEWAAMNSIGRSGGIIVLWDKRQWSNRGIQQGCYTISCMLESTQEDFRWCFTGVYGPHTNPEREDLWHELAAIRGLWDEQWVTGGTLMSVDMKVRD